MKLGVITRDLLVMGRAENCRATDPGTEHARAVQSARVPSKVKRSSAALGRFQTRSPLIEVPTAVPVQVALPLVGLAAVAVNLAGAYGIWWSSYLPVAKSSLA